MGQAWCKEKSSKAQDSKSPLDRVFVRCAHSIYPGLKEEGSVLGGATQRVTSSEIGYAGSPPRSALLRGQSIDSVDRPFHPSDWVDVNLEVPCTPRASVVLTSVNLCPVRQQRTNHSNCSKGSRDGATPVPPPRRRKRREKRPLPPKPSDGADEESEPDPLYSKLKAPRSAEDVNASTATLDDTEDGEHAAEDSEEEFAELERTLEEKGSPKDATSAKRRLQQQRARPKNHSTTSLPNVVELTTSAEELGEAAAAVTTRPPRHAKTTSLPRDAALFPPQTPERIFFGRTAGAAAAAATAARRSASEAEDNSISRIDASPDVSLTFEADVKTSTPVKAEAAASRSLNDPDDVFESFQDESSESRDSSSPRQGAEVEERRPASPAAVAAAAAAEAPRRSEDLGYESRSSGSHLFSDGSNDESARARTAELSSGILRDATPDSCDPDGPENPTAALQRTISEESLPREMLLEELEEEEDEGQRQLDGEKSAKDTSNQLARQISSASEGVTFGTPPPSPEPKVHTSCASSSSREPSSQRPASTEEPPDTAAKKSAAEGGGDSNLTSMTPSLLELEAALTSMLEKKDEQEREQSEAVMWSKPDKSDVSAEPQIVPVKLNRSADERQAGEDLGKLSPQPAKSRLIDFPRTDRTNPFNDLKSDDSDLNSSADDPPEKPSRLHRVSLSEDSPLTEPLIVPTPPRRRHRSKSGLNSSSLSCSPPVPLHTFASGGHGDRLI